MNWDFAPRDLLERHQSYIADAAVQQQKADDHKRELKKLRALKKKQARATALMNEHRSSRPAATLSPLSEEGSGDSDYCAEKLLKGLSDGLDEEQYDDEGEDARCDEVNGDDGKDDDDGSNNGGSGSDGEGTSSQGTSSQGYGQSNCSGGGIGVNDRGNRDRSEE